MVEDLIEERQQPLGRFLPRERVGPPSERLDYVFGVIVVRKQEPRRVRRLAHVEAADSGNLLGKHLGEAPLTRKDRVGTPAAAASKGTSPKPSEIVGYNTSAVFSTSQRLFALDMLPTSRSIAEPGIADGPFRFCG